MGHAQDNPVPGDAGDHARRDPPALRTALDLLARGLWPVPIHAPGDEIRQGGEVKIAIGKEPIGAAWGRTRHTEATLRAVWARQPRAGVGLKLGREGRVIDVEGDGPEAEASRALLFGGEEVKTLGWGSARGPHTLLAWDDRLARYGKSIVKVESLPGLEIRIGAIAEGGKQLQSVVPPTPNVDGTPRAWNGAEEIAAIPEAFFVFLDPILLPLEEEPGPAPATIPLRVPRPEGPGLERRIWPYLQTLPEAIEGQRGHDKLYRAACVLVDGFALSFEEALPYLLRFNDEKAVPPESEQQIRHKLSDAIKNTRRTGYLLHAERPGVERREPSRRSPGASAESSDTAPPAEADEETPILVREWPQPPDPVVYHGLGGELVRALEPHTESDPLAILVQLLVAFGNLAGRSAYWAIEADRHYANLFAALIGPSSKGRKGTSWGHARRLLKAIDPAWADTRIVGGLSSGEGLIYAVRDPVYRREPIRAGKGKNAPITGYEQILSDPGESDKRLLALEPELASVLKVIAREGNTLSALLRRCWDDGNLRTLIKNNPNVATDAHVSIIGHITRDEVQKLLTGTEAANGFGNRFLWLCVCRSKLLPFGGLAHQLDFAPLLRQLHEVAEVARARGEMTRDGAADELWERAYRQLAEGKPGLLGAILGRAEAQVMRLALVYALLDGTDHIGRVHLEAALALWRYVEDSARYVFGDALGDPEAEAILAALRAAPEGLTRGQISVQVFGKNKTSGEITLALTRLLEAGFVRHEKVKTGGRPAETWFAVGGGSER